MCKEWFRNKWKSCKNIDQIFTLIIEYFSNTKEILETRTIEISQICLKENNNLLILRYLINICEQNINIYELIL